MSRGILRYWLLCAPVVFAVLLSSCAAPLHKALDPAEITSIEQTHVRATIEQEEISMYVVKSTAGDNVAAGGGVCCVLMGSVIDKSVDSERSKKAEAWIATLLEQTSDMDFRKDYWNEILPMLRSLTWLKLGETDLAAAPKTLSEEWLNDDVLLLWATYQLTPEGRFLVVTSLARFWTMPKSKPSYYGQQTYVSEAIAPPYSAKEQSAKAKYDKDDRKQTTKGRAAATADFVAKWAEDGAAIYRAAIEEGIQETVRMIRFDLPDADQNIEHLSGSPARIKMPSLVGGRGLESATGEILDRGTDRIIFRLKNGNLMSLPLADIEILE